jgi:hypothetical protein
MIFYSFFQKRLWDFCRLKNGLVIHSSCCCKTACGSQCACVVRMRSQVPIYMTLKRSKENLRGRLASCKCHGVGCLRIRSLVIPVRLVSRISSHPAVFFSHNKLANSTLSTINQRNEQAESLQDPSKKNSGFCKSPLFFLRTSAAARRKLRANVCAVWATFLHFHVCSLARSCPHLLRFLRQDHSVRTRSPKLSKREGCAWDFFFFFFPWDLCHVVSGCWTRRLTDFFFWAIRRLTDC